MTRNKPKILYAAGDRVGAAYQLRDFISKEFEIRIAGYSSLNLTMDYFDWTLDPLIAQPELLDRIKNDILNWEPDFAIIDCEPIVADIAHQFGIPIIKCSPLHLIDGVRWKRGQQRYTNTIETTRQLLGRLPPAIATLIYAPYAFTGADLKPGYEWIEPYAVSLDVKSSVKVAVIDNEQRLQKLNPLLSRFTDRISTRRNQTKYEKDLSDANIIFSLGETSVITDALVNAKSILISPDVKDPENVVNALMCSAYELGLDLGQIELLGPLALNELQSFFERPLQGSTRYVPVGKLLDERIIEIWESMLHLT